MSAQDVLIDLEAKHTMASSRRAHGQLPSIDVTDCAFHFDLNWLQSIPRAAAWLTRAERLMLFSLTFCLRPERYLEIGTFEGGSALIVCSALDAVGSRGRMFLVDPDPKIPVATMQSIRHRAEVFRGSSPEILPTIASCAEKPFDLVFIDGDHSFEACLSDALGAYPYVAGGGHILFHDAFFPEVRSAIDEFVDACSEQVTDIGLLTRESMTSITEAGERVEWGGLRLIKKTGSPPR